MTGPQPQLLQRLLAAAILATLTGCANLPGLERPDDAPPPAVVDLGDWTAGAVNIDAPEQIQQFGQFVGVWEARQRSLQQDGSSWVDAPHPALWRWYWILDGHAIQDDWIAPAPGIDPGAGGRGYGTNIRVYNQDKGHWEMAWISSRGQEAWEFTAKWDSRRKRMVMESVDLTPPRRNIFHNITGDSFQWTQEWSFDNGKTWVAVAKIDATRVR